MKPLATFSLYELENYEYVTHLRSWPTEWGNFVYISFLVFVHRYIINFVGCVYKVDLDTTRKMSKL